MTRLQVLLVADDLATVQPVLAALGAARAPDLDARVARDLDAAVAALGGGGIDVVALDLRLLPAASTAALRRLRAAAPAVCLVAVAAHDAPGLAARAFHDGAEELVVLDQTEGEGLARSLRHAFERHLIHASLRLQAEQHQAIVEGSIQGIVIHQDGVIRYANAALARLMGYDSAAELIGQSALAHVAPHERDRLVALGQMRHRGGPVPTQYEFEARRRDGSPVRLECLVTPIEWQGRPANVSTMLDVTARQQTQDAVLALAEVDRELVGPVSLSEAAARIASRVRGLFSARLAAVYRLDAAAPDTLTCIAADGGRSPGDWVGRSIRVGEGLTGLAVGEGQAVWSDDVAADPRIVVPAGLRTFMATEGFRSGIAVPLRSVGVPVGALFLGDTPPDIAGPERRALLASFADRAALALERATLYERAESRAENLAVLVRVSGLIASATDSGHVLEAVAQAAISLLAASAATVLVDDPAAGVLQIGAHQRAGAAAPSSAAEAPPAGDVARDVFASGAPAFVQTPGAGAYAGLPLVARGRAIGVLSIFFPDRRAFTGEERELMGMLAGQAAIAIDNARLLQETERRRRAAEALADVARLVAHSLDIAEVSARITETVAALLGVSNAALFRFRPQSNDLESLSLRGDHGPTGGKAIVYPVGFGAAGLAVQERKAVVTADLLADPRIRQPAAQRARMERASFRAILAVPLLVQGRVVGVLVLGDRVGRRFTDEEVQIAEAFADRAAVALDAAQVHAEVRDARDFSQSIAASSADAIVTTDVRGRITYWSPGAEETLGYSAAEALGRPAAEFYVKGTEEARAIMTRLRAESRMREYETTIQGRDGRTLTVSASFALLRDAGGAITGTVAVVKDVTERKTLEESFRQSQKMEAVGRLAGGVAHDFNNLMTVIIGRCQLLLSRLHAEDPLRRDIELFRKTGERAAQLTRQLLAFSRKQMLQPKVLDLNAVVENLEAMLHRLIGEDVELRSILRPRLGRVRADPGQLEQVLVNLAVNARDAMSEGGTLTIETAAADLDEAFVRAHPGVSPGAHVALSVADTGAGMDEATLGRIFEPFFTTKGPGKGTGLGLSTVYGIIRQSGGTVAVDSAPGAGTTFRIYLPRVEDLVEPADAEPGAEPWDQGTETILLVEDQDELRDVGRETLEACGYTVLEARHGTEALLVAERHAGSIDLLLTDVIMPGMNGAELARRLAPARPEMAILFVSGYTDDAIARHGVLDAGTAFLEKPFSPDQLARRVRETLSARP